MTEADIRLHFINDPALLHDVERVQQAVWGPEDVVPDHMLLSLVHGGGVLIGAYERERLVGFVFGFPAFDQVEGRIEVRHHSHLLAVLPEKRDLGIGFKLKRAQWQWVRRQGVERITWTYDPLQSRNAYLNIGRLGAVCSTYLPNYYGEMTDTINAGMPSDRFFVDWWVNSPRVNNRLEKRPRRPLDLGDYFSAGAEIINPTRLAPSGFPAPPENTWLLESLAQTLGTDVPPQQNQPPFYLVEIPPDIQQLRAAEPALALHWRQHTREVLTALFLRGYLVTDFVFTGGESPRSFYLLSDGERRLAAFSKKS